MVKQEKINLDITLSMDGSLRDLENQRNNLFNVLLESNSDEIGDIFIEEPSRSLDPAIIGTLAVSLFPVAAEKLIDLITDWIKKNKKVSVSIKIAGNSNFAIDLTYDPKTMKPEEIKSLIKQLAVSEKNDMTI